jgi:hydrogenase expression/formation protein HypC
MCLGIPGQVIEREAASDLALIDVSGVRRTINVALLDDDVRSGDWVLIHVGFALARIDEAEAQRALSMLQMMGSGLNEELEALVASTVTEDAPRTGAPEGGT